MEEYNEIYGKLLNNFTIASWNYETSFTDENSQIASDSKLQMSKCCIQQKLWKDSTNFTEDTRRQLKEVCDVFIHDSLKETEFCTFFSPYTLHIYGYAHVFCYQLTPNEHLKLAKFMAKPKFALTVTKMASNVTTWNLN